ncbi:hypothetical protein EVAR_29442_1 [Eumeta japonica]|uniref:Uncharacterized protein n=1 Tax=Eumeta variegata TaxID=151549 RepID=A0A4C1VW57_EUMVA|nr:hypothetical protein EVAR_29442_1 [Eumeta japonica]
MKAHCIHFLDNDYDTAEQLPTKFESLEATGLHEKIDGYQISKKYMQRSYHIEIHSLYLPFWGIGSSNRLEALDTVQSTSRRRAIQVLRHHITGDARHISKGGTSKAAKAPTADGRTDGPIRYVPRHNLWANPRMSCATRALVTGQSGAKPVIYIVVLSFFLNSI